MTQDLQANTWAIKECYTLEPEIQQKDANFKGLKGLKLIFRTFKKNLHNN